MKSAVSCLCPTLILLQIAFGGAAGFAAAPTCTLTGPASPTNLNPFTVRIDWNEQVIGFDLSDVQVTNGTASNLRMKLVSPTPATAALSQARQFLAAVAVGTKAIFAGGRCSSGLSGVVDIYDAATGGWTTAQLSQARWDLAGVSVGTKALFAGGTASGAPVVATVDIYDGQTGTWSTGALGSARSRIAAASVGTKAFFGGGYAVGSDSAAVDIFESTTGVWTTAALSQGRQMAVAASAGGKVLFAGGHTQAGSWSTVVDIYDTATDTWSTASLTAPRDQLAAASVGSKVLFGGGSYGSSQVGSDVVDIYDTATDTWTTAALSQARGRLAAASAGTLAFFAGGFTGSGWSDVVDIYDSATGAWSVAHLSAARENLVGTCTGTKVLFGGGDTGYIPGPWSNVVEIFDLYREVDIAPVIDGNVSVSVPAGACTDAAGAPSSASNVLNILYDGPPTCTVTGPASPTNSSALLFPIIFSEDVTGLNPAGFSVTGGAANALVVNDPRHYTLVVLASVQGTVTCQVNAGAAHDAMGNPNLASNIASVVYDSVAPTGTFAPIVPNVRYSPLESASVAFTEPVFQFDLTDLALTRDGTAVPMSGATLTGSAANWTIGNLAASTAPDGAYQLLLNTSDIIDAAGNTLAAPVSMAWTMDTRTDLVLCKTAQPQAVINGEQTTFTLEVGNAGPTDAVSVLLVDALPASLEFVSESVAASSVDGATRTWALGTLAPGDMTTITLVVRAVAAGTVVNTATVACSKEDRLPSDNTASASIDVGTAADVGVSAAPSPVPPLLGQPLSYVINVSNVGPDDARDVVVSDMIATSTLFTSASVTQGSVASSGASVTGELGTIARGGSAQMTVTVVPQQEGPIGNTAAVTSMEVDPDTSNNVAETTVTVILGPGPDLAGTWQWAMLRDPVWRKWTVAGRFVVTNRGDAASGWTNVKFYLSEKSQFDSTAKYVGFRRLPIIGPGRSRSVGGSKDIIFHTSGPTKYVIAVIDPENKVAESNELNNTSPYDLGP